MTDSVIEVAFIAAHTVDGETLDMKIARLGAHRHGLSKLADQLTASSANIEVRGSARAPLHPLLRDLDDRRKDSRGAHS